MRHSNRRNIHWAFVAIEICLFVGAVITSYLSKMQQWPLFFSISAILVVLFAAIKIISAWPEAKDLLIREDTAAKIADAAVEYGVVRYFNMQIPSDQAARNENTLADIEEAQSLWLCANSGASYLDPQIYRHWSAIEKRLKAGVEFRCVLLDPTSPEKVFRNQLNTDGEAFDSKLNIANLIILQNRFPTLEIRFASQGMHMTVFVTEKCLYLDPYHVGIKEGRIDNRSFCLRIEPVDPKDGIGLHRLYKSHFDTLWRAGKTFEDWIIDNGSKLPDSMPTLRRTI